jgi:hypothetical protein
MAQRPNVYDARIRDRDETTKRARRSTAQARARFDTLGEAAAKVYLAHQRVRAGRASFAERQLVEYASPGKRDEAMRRTGSVLMPRREATARAVSVLRQQFRREAPRVAVTRAFTGKAKVVRGYTLPAGLRAIGVGKAAVQKRR